MSTNQYKNDPRYEVWVHALGYPGEQLPDDERSVDGWWRIKATARKTQKPDWPVVGWHDDAGVGWVQVGRAKPMMEGSDDYLRFRSAHWFSCEPVEMADYEYAIANGAWKDGYPSRNADAPEPEAPAPAATEEPAPYIPNDTRPLEIVMSEDIDALVELAASIPETIADQATADKAVGYMNRLRAIRQKAEDTRVTQKEPHLTAGREVDAKWAVVKDKADKHGIGLKTRVDAYLRAEERKQREAAEAARKAEEARLAAEGTEPQPEPERRAGPGPAPAQARSAFGGTAYSLRTKKIGVITDAAKFIKAIRGHSDFKEFLQTKANAAARANSPLPGMTIEEQR